MTLSWPADIESYLLDRVKQIENIQSMTDVLLYTDTELANRAGISVKSARRILGSIASQYAPPPVSIQELANLNDRVSSGLPELDRILCGGFPRNWISEIVGESATGKTQLCLSIAAQALMSSRKVFWIDTDGSFRPERLLDILDGRSNLLENVCVSRCRSLSALVDCIVMLKESLDSRTVPSPVLIVDSVASAARAERSSLIDRNELLQRFARIIKSIPIVAVVTNHVSANLNGSGVSPALGNTWSHTVTCRLFIHVRDDSPKRRWLEVLKCPTSQEKSPEILFLIDRKGVKPV
jgi:hypothetical protein